MQEERKKILEMLAEGTISVEKRKFYLTLFLRRKKRKFGKRDLVKSLKKTSNRRGRVLKAKENFKKQLEKLNLEEKARIGFKSKFNLKRNQ